MVDQIALSENTLKMIQEFVTLTKASVALPDFENNDRLTEMAVLLKCLSERLEVEEEYLFFLESLYSLLLIDLYESFSSKKDKKPDAESDWFATIKFVLLAAAGTIFFGCEGFDRITTILGITSLPSSIIFVAGLGFSLLSIVVFFAFDLVEISNNLGVDLSGSHKIVDVYLQQIETIKAIRKEIDGSFSEKSMEQLQKDIAILDMLTVRYQVLATVGKSLKQALDNPVLYAFKLITAGIAGIIFFSGGYIAGQTVTMAIFGLFIVGVTPLFWPVIIGNLIAGIAALSVYWFVERPGIEDLIGRWVGLDKDKLSRLCDEDEVQKEQNHLSSLVGKLEIRSRDLERISEGESKIKLLENKLQRREEPSETKIQERPTLLRQLSANSFFRPQTGHEALVAGDILNTEFISPV